MSVSSAFASASLQRAALPCERASGASEEDGQPPLLFANCWLALRAQVHCQLLELLELVEIKLVGEDLNASRSGTSGPELFVVGCPWHE